MVTSVSARVIAAPAPIQRLGLISVSVGELVGDGLKSVEPIEADQDILVGLILPVDEVEIIAISALGGLFLLATGIGHEAEAGESAEAVVIGELGDGHAVDEEEAAADEAQIVIGEIGHGDSTVETSAQPGEKRADLVGSEFNLFHATGIATMVPGDLIEPAGAFGERCEPLFGCA